MDFDYSDPQFKENVQLVVKDYFKSGSFKDRKLTDTPTDDLQVVNKAYSDRNKITYSSVAGEYLNGNGAFALPQYVTGTAGEDLLANDAVFISNASTDYTIVSITGRAAQIDIGTNASLRVAQSFSFPLSTQLISKITVTLEKIGTPADNLVLTLRSSLDGTILQTIATIPASSLTNGVFANFSYTLTDFVCAKNTLYYVEAARSGGVDDANFYRWKTATGDVYANGDGAKIGTGGGGWTTGLNDFAMVLKMTTASGNIYKCRTDIAGFFENFNGFNYTATSMAGTATVNVGMQQTLASLTGRYQYLTDSPGLISSTPGTNVKEAGVAFSATQLELSPMFLRNFTSGVSSINSPTTTNIAHNLGMKPRFVRITSLGGATTPVMSMGVYKGNSTSTVYYQLSGFSGATTDTSNIIYIQGSSGNSIRATITTDATNLILVSTLTGTATATFMWEAYS